MKIAKECLSKWMITGKMRMHSTFLSPWEIHLSSSLIPFDIPFASLVRD